MSRKKQALSLTKATRQAEKLMLSTSKDAYVVAKRVMGDYHIMVMGEKDFYPHTSLRLQGKFHDILRVRRYKFQGWTKDPNQGGFHDAE